MALCHKAGKYNIENKFYSYDKKLEGKGSFLVAAESYLFCVTEKSIYDPDLSPFTLLNLL